MPFIFALISVSGPISRRSVQKYDLNAKLHPSQKKGDDFRESEKKDSHMRKKVFFSPKTVNLHYNNYYLYCIIF